MRHRGLPVTGRCCMPGCCQVQREGSHFHGMWKTNLPIARQVLKPGSPWWRPHHLRWRWMLRASEKVPVDVVILLSMLSRTIFLDFFPPRLLPQGLGHWPKKIQRSWWSWAVRKKRIWHVLREKNNVLSSKRWIIFLLQTQDSNKLTIPFNQ